MTGGQKTFHIGQIGDLLVGVDRGNITSHESPRRAAGVEREDKA
jgi:hypothetical protein